MHITLLDYASLLTYSPRGSSPAMDQAREVMKIIKTDAFVEEPPILISEWIAKTVKQYMAELPFASFS